MPFELAPLASCTLEYAFAPLDGGAFEHTVLVDAATDGATPAFNLLGRGSEELQSPAARIVPRSIDASLAPIDQPADATPRPYDCHLDASRVRALGIDWTTPFDTALQAVLRNAPPLP